MHIVHLIHGNDKINAGELKPGSRDVVPINAKLCTDWTHLLFVSETQIKIEFCRDDCLKASLNFPCPVDALTPRFVQTPASCIMFD